jgi:WD40 repeat protein
MRYEGLKRSPRRQKAPTVALERKEQTVGEYVMAVSFSGHSAIAILVDGAMCAAACNSDDMNKLQAHHGAIVCAKACRDRTGLITACDQGEIRFVSRSGTTLLAQTGNSSWVTSIATGEKGQLAYSVGKAIAIVGPDRTVTEVAMNASVADMEFSLDGVQLAVAHYGGVSLIDVSEKSLTPERLEWRGSHIRVTQSPDGRFVVSAMAENALHGWRLEDALDMRMTGYLSKPKSFSWSSCGTWLATSGCDSVTLWPFSGYDGPMGKPPVAWGARHNILVMMVAFHPSLDYIAAGYEDGFISLIRNKDGAVMPLREAGKGEISALSFSPDGVFLAYGTANGSFGLIRLSKEV